jgi:hypothetical protein
VKLRTNSNQIKPRNLLNQNAFFGTVFFGQGHSRSLDHITKQKGYFGTFWPYESAERNINSCTCTLNNHKLIVYRTWSSYLRSINLYLYYRENFNVYFILLMHVDCLPDGIYPVIASEGDSLPYLHVCISLIVGYFKSCKPYYKIGSFLCLRNMAWRHWSGVKITCIFYLFTSVTLHASPAFIPKKESWNLLPS